MECRGRQGKNKTEKKDETSRRQRKPQTEEFSNAFPNFMALTREEKLAFFEMLSIARQNVEKRGTPMRGSFGTVHDEYLKHFSSFQKIEEDNERGEEETEEEAEEEDHQPQDHVAAANNTPSDVTTCSPSTVICSSTSSVKTSASISKSISCNTYNVPTTDAFLKKNSSDNFDLTEPKIELKTIEKHCETILTKDRDKIIDLYVSKKNRRQEESWLETSLEDLEILDSLEDYDFGEKESPKNDVKDKKDKKPKKLRLLNKPKFDALNAEEREVFFKTLREAHDNILEKNPDKKNEIIPLDVILKTYEDSPAPEVTRLLMVNEQGRSKTGKNLKVKVTIKSGDNERLKGQSVETPRDTVDPEELEEEIIPETETKPKSKPEPEPKPLKDGKDTSKMKKKKTKEDSVKEKEIEEELLKDSKFKIVPKDSLVHLKKELTKQHKSKTDLAKTESNSSVHLKLKKKEQENKTKDFEKKNGDEEIKKEEQEKSKPEQKKEKDKSHKKEEYDKKKNEHSKKKQKVEEGKKSKKEPKTQKNNEENNKDEVWEDITDLGVLPFEKEKEHDLKGKDNSLLVFEKKNEKELTSEILNSDNGIEGKKKMAELKHLKEEKPLKAEVIETLNELNIDYNGKLKEIERIEEVRYDMESRKEFMVEDYIRNKGKKEEETEKVIFTMPSKEEESNLSEIEKLSVESKLQTDDDVKSEFEKGDGSQSIVHVVDKDKEEKDKPKVEGDDIVMEANVETFKIESVTETLTNLKDETDEEEETRVRKDKLGEKPKTRKSKSGEKYPRKTKSGEQARKVKSLADTLEDQVGLSKSREHQATAKTNKADSGLIETIQLADLTEKLHPKKTDSIPVETTELSAQTPPLATKQTDSKSAETTELAAPASTSATNQDTEQATEAYTPPTVVEANVAQVSNTEKKSFVEDKADKSSEVLQYKTGKVVLMDDDTIDKIRDLISELEKKANPEGNNLENEYLYLLLGYIDYLSNVLESLLLQKKRARKNEPMPGTSKTVGTYRLTFEDAKKARTKPKPNFPRSISDQDLSEDSRFVYPDEEENKNRNQKKYKVEEDEKTIAPKRGFHQTSDSDSDSSIDSQEAIDQGYIMTRKKAHPITKIRLLQDLLKERAKFVEGSIDDFKIIHLPEPEFVSTSTEDLVTELRDSEEERSERGTRERFLRMLARLCSCGKKEVHEEDEVLENLKGEAVAVDVSVDRTKNAASATLNESTMNVLKAADRRKMIQKYWKQI